MQPAREDSVNAGRDRHERVDRGLAATRLRAAGPLRVAVPAASSGILALPSRTTFMPTFDITTGADLQEVDNALNQARKELENRYDFKGTKWSMEFDRKTGKLMLSAEDSTKLDAMWDIVGQKMVKRGVSLRNLDAGKPVEGTLGSSRREITIIQAIEKEKAKEIVRYIKEANIKKVQGSVQGDTVRVTGPKRDDLQECMAALKRHEFGIELKYGNFRD